MNYTDSEEGEDRRVCEEIRKIKDEAEKRGEEAVVGRLGNLAADLLRMLHPSALLWSSLSSLCAILLSSQRCLPSPSLPLLLEVRELLSYLPASSLLHPELNDLLGQAYLAAGQTYAALLCLHEAVRAEVPLSDRCSPYIHLSLAYFRLENYRQAVRYATQAVIWALEDLHSAFPTSKIYSHRKARVMSLYTLLAECEDALGRSDRVDYWLKRSISSLSFQGIQGGPHCPSPAMGEFLSEPQPASRSSIATVDYCWSCDSKESSLSFGGRHRKMSELEKKPEEMLRTGTTDSIQEKERMKTNSTENSSGRHRVSLKIRSRGQTVSAVHQRILHHSWRHLASGLFADITVSEAPGENWIVSVKAVGEDKPRAEKFIEKRDMTPKDVASIVELSDNDEIIVKESRSVMLSALTSTEPVAKRTILYSEKKTFNGLLYDIIYTLDETTRNVTIYAKTRGKTIRKTIINDILLPSNSAVLTYVKEVLAPQVEVTGEKIILESKPECENFTLVLTKETVIQPDFECKVTIFRPNEPYLNWKINAEGRIRMFLEVSEREITELTQCFDHSSVAEAVFGLLVVENGSKLSLIRRHFHTGYAITVSSVPDNIQYEYRRQPIVPSPRSGIKSQSIEDHAAIVLQRFVRKRIALRRVRLMKLGVKAGYRFAAKAQGGYQMVAVSQAKAGIVKICSRNVTTKAAKSVEVPASEVDFSSQRSVEETALRQLSSPTVREPDTGLRLLVTRRQVIKGENYLISVYTRDGRVEIKAIKQR